MQDAGLEANPAVPFCYIVGRKEGRKEGFKVELIELREEPLQIRVNEWLRGRWIDGHTDGHEDR